QLSRMAARIGQRVIGAVLSRLVSTVAGVVGVVLIAKDIWDFRHGVLPIIAEEMKSKATKDSVRQEMATTLSEQVGQGVKEIARAQPSGWSRSGWSSAVPTPRCWSWPSATPTSSACLRRSGR